jgi:hypothetical protein
MGNKGASLTGFFRAPLGFLDCFHKRAAYDRGIS